MNFEKLLDAAPDAMLFVGPQGTIHFVNRQAEVDFGYAREELVGQPIESLVPGSSRHLHLPRTGSEADLQPRVMSAGLELTGQRRDGSEFPVDISLSSIETEDGVLVTAAVRDITDRLWVDQRFERVAAIIEYSDDAIIGQSLAGIVESWNQAAERLYGYSADEAVGMPASVLVPPGQVDDVLQILDRVGRGERVEHYETSRISKQGQIIDVSVSASPTRDSRGVLHGATTIARDITDRKRTETTIMALNADLEHRVDLRTLELADANEELEAFSYSVAHDLRAPLRAIDGFSRVLMEEYEQIVDAEGRRLLGVIRRATTDMSDLIDALLEFSRVGRKPIQMTVIDMEELVATVVQEIAPTYTGRNVTVTVGTLPDAAGDRALVRQVLVNLLSNAVKFTEHEEQAQINITGSIEEGRPVFRVADNGVGFDIAYEAKLFQVFQRLQPGEFSGTGVGLAIVQRIVRRHGGQVWATGEVDGGANFTFSLRGGELAS